MEIEQCTFRRFEPSDSLEELTDLLHRAYADHALAGRVFFASYQAVQDTRERISRGECWLAVREGKMVGTVTVTGCYHAPPDYPAPPYAGSFHQLAVLPEYRTTGLGNRLLELAEQRIRQLGATTIVIDTASTATDLIAWYQRRGYAEIGRWNWDVTNYESVVLRKRLE